MEPSDSYSVRIEPQGWQFDAPRGQSLRASAQAAGIVMPSSCRNGTCRECLCRLTQGQIRHAIAWPGLSVDEKREGFILPCVAMPESDVVILAPWAQRQG
jgi:ferredoxin